MYIWHIANIWSKKEEEDRKGKNFKNKIGLIFCSILDLDDLINQTREQQTATLQEVEWRGRKLPVKQEKIRIFLLREQEFNETEVQGKTFQDQISAYEGLLMDCKDALQTLRDDLIEDPTFRNRQQASEGPVAPVHFLYTYLTFMK